MYRSVSWHLLGKSFGDCTRRCGLRRFGELRRLVGTATQRMLTNQLRELESDGLITRKIFAEIPSRAYSRRRRQVATASAGGNVRMGKAQNGTSLTTAPLA